MREEGSRKEEECNLGTRMRDTREECGSGSPDVPVPVVGDTGVTGGEFSW